VRVLVGRELRRQLQQQQQPRLPRLFERRVLVQLILALLVLVPPLRARRRRSSSGRRGRGGRGRGAARRRWYGGGRRVVLGDERDDALEQRGRAERHVRLDIGREIGPQHGDVPLLVRVAAPRRGRQLGQQLRAEQRRVVGLVQAQVGEAAQQVLPRHLPRARVGVEAG